MITTSYEQRLIAHFIMQTKADQKRIIEEAQIAPGVSGPVMQAYRWLYENT